MTQKKINKRVDILHQAARYLKQPRTLLRGTLLEYVLVAALFTAITAVLTGGVLFHINTQLFSGSGDATAGFLWLNFADPGLNPILGYTDKANYPVGEDLGGPTFIAYSALWLPLRVLSYMFGPVVGLNLMMVLGFVSSAMSMYWLLKRLTGNIAVSFIGGFAVAFVPYAVYKSVAHLSYIFSGAFSLIILSFLELLRKPKLIWSILLAVSLAIAFYTDGYYVLLSVVLMIGLIVSGILYAIAKRFKASDYRTIAKHGAIAITAFLILITPLFIVKFTSSSEIDQQLADNRSDTAVEFKMYRSNVIDFITPPINHVIWRDNPTVQRMSAIKDQRSNISENTNYIAFTIYALCLLGVCIAIYGLTKNKFFSLLGSKEGDVLLLAILVGVVCVPLLLAFMFSPEIIVGGINLKLPGQLLLDFQISLWRVLSRFFVVFNLVVVLVAMVSLYAVLSLIEKTKKVPAKTNIKNTLVIICALLIGFEYLSYFPERPFDFKKQPQTYSWLKARSDINTVAELPFVDPLDSLNGDYFTAQEIHGKKLLNMKEPGSIRITNALGDSGNQETVNLLNNRGVDAVIKRTLGVANCPKVVWGNLIYQETTHPGESKEQYKNKRNLCVYKPIKDQDADKVFVRFTKGFSPSPNSPDQSNVVFSDGAKGNVEFTTSNFSTRASGSVDFSADINVVVDAPRASWRLLQDGVVKGSGSLDRGKAHINTRLDATKEATIEIVSPGTYIRLPQAYISNVVVTSSR